MGCIPATRAIIEAWADCLLEESVCGVVSETSLRLLWRALAQRRAPDE